MDPNATLQMLRDLLGGDSSGKSDFHKKNAWMEAEELFQALDDWLSKGGALPKAWIPRPPLESELCDKCTKNLKKAPHSCPYAHDIHDDPDSLCTCCEECEHACAQEI